ncbi:MAG: single-stranded DNA-binding protein [Synergistaceae bacterium]|nr:single-stranded DNA-binding protein [Synergistaceae bacterium]
MRGLNKVIVAGNLARDPEVRYTVNKKAYASFTVAANRSYRDANGEFKEGTDYVPVVVWGAQAESCGKFLKKGSPVLVEGRFTTRSYEARDGSGKRYISEVNVDNVVFLSTGQRGGGRPETGFPGPSMGLDYMPTDDDFGSPIGENGFNLESPDSGQDSSSDIPF